MSDQILPDESEERPLRQLEVGELEQILADHKQWLEPEDGEGQKANLEKTCLQGVEIIAAGDDAGIDIADSGTYATSQGPRLESSAEVNAMASAGAHMVGMTGMPEAALARELDLSYASCAVVSNWAAGRAEKPITMDTILKNLDRGMIDVRRLLEHLVIRL